MERNEIAPQKRSSGKPIEKMYENDVQKGEKGMAGETLRPSEREPKYTPEDKAEDKAEDNAAYKPTSDKPEGER
ncbi:MAG: hypothetical protein V4692_10075 [Bdellovibrionota bacterium]